MRVLYVDNHILAVDKPHGMLTQPSGTDLQNLEEEAKRWVKERYGKPGAVFLHAIHRLDRDAGGIVLFARTSKALERLQKAIRSLEFEKVYRAIVSPPPPHKEATVEHWLIHGDHRAEVAAAGAAGAKRAILRYTCVDVVGDQATLEVTLVTGRYHQIRAQLAAIGSPIVGDVKYGSTLPHSPGIALTHIRLRFVHPVTQAAIEIVR